MVKELSVKLSDDIHEKLEKLAEKTGKSKADILREALIMYIGSEVGEKTVEDVRSYTKPALYSGKCAKCNKEIQQGDIAGFVKVIYSDKSAKTFIYCLDCYNTMSDKTIISLELRKHRLKKVATALSREISRAISLYDEIEKSTELITKIKNYITDLNKYLNLVYQGKNEDIKKLIFEISELNNQISELIKLLQIRRETYRKALAKISTQ